MPDEFIEKVLKGLECCNNISPDGCLMLCPYKDEQDETYSGFCEHVLKRDALQLLEFQQAEINRLKIKLNCYEWERWRIKMITIGIIISCCLLIIGIVLMRDDDLYRWLKKNKFIR